jgi:hypothetical protein
MAIPPLTLEDDTWWVADTWFASWSGFQSRYGDCGSVSAPQPSDGSVLVVFAPEGRGPEPLTSDELTLIEWLFANEPEVSRAAQQAILNEYPRFRARAAEFQVDGWAKMPETLTLEGLKSLIGLHSVNVHQISSEGLPYIGFELGCTWDEEHGLGVLMHGTHPVEVAGADTAILLWIAEEHAEKRATASGA